MRLTIKMIGKTISTFILALSFHVVHVKKSFQVKKIELHISKGPFVELIDATFHVMILAS